MNRSFKKAARHTFLGALAAITVMAGLIAGCSDGGQTAAPKTEAGGTHGELVLIKTEQGGCNITNSIDKTAASASERSPVTITESGNTVNMHVAIGGNCGAKFETNTYTTDGILYIGITDISDPMEMTNCICNFTFDFTFEKRGNVSQEYVVSREQAGECAVFIATGTIGGGGHNTGSNGNGNNTGGDFPIVPEAKYIRTDYYGSDVWPVPAGITIISSRAELEEYYEKTKRRYSDGYGNPVPDNNYLSAIEGYDDNYFAGRFLVTVKLVESSGSTRHRVDSIYENGDINISRTIGDTADIGAWSILIELDNKFKNMEFRAGVVDVNQYEYVIE